MMTKSLSHEREQFEMLTIAKLVPEDLLIGAEGA
jgi:hypothetical protein